MSKKHKKKKSKKLKSVFIQDLKNGLMQLRSTVLNTSAYIKNNLLSLINLVVGLYTLSEVKALHEAMDNVANTIVAASLSGYINTMILFSALESELKSLVSLFSGSPS